MIRWLGTAFAALLLAASPAAAQIQQSGTVSPGHASCWVTSGLLKDGGSPANFQCNALGLYNGTNSPLGISSQTAAGALSGTWGTLTLGSTSSAASLTTLNSAGTAQPLNLAIGGDATYAIGGTNWLSTIFGQQFCTTTGAVLYRDSGGTWKCLAPGTSGQVLQTQGPNLNPQWAGSGGIGTVTSITAGTGLSGGTINTSGTIALLNPVAVNLGGTGAATLAAHGVLIGNGTTAVNVATPGVAGTVLQSNGAGADPTWNAVAGTGTVTSITAADGTVTVSPSPLVTSGTVKVATNGVANANLAQMALGTIKGNVTGATANVADVALANLLRSYLAGLTMSNDGGTPNTIIDTSAGIAMSDDQTLMMSLAAFTKTTGAWAVGSGNGCLDTGAVGASATYHLFVIERPDTSVVDELCSLSASSPTLPANYTKKRRIGSFLTDGSSHIVTFNQLGDKYLLLVSQNNFNTTQSTAAQLITTSAPTGVQVDVLIRGQFLSGTAGLICLINSPDQTSVAAGATTGDFNVEAPTTTAGQAYDLQVRTNTSGQVRAIANGSGTLQLTTYGWVDTRGRFN